MSLQESGEISETIPCSLSTHRLCPRHRYRRGNGLLQAQCQPRCRHFCGGGYTMWRKMAASLTESGQAVAEKDPRASSPAHQLLVKLMLTKKTAAEDACKIEHVISDASMEAITATPWATSSKFTSEVRLCTRSNVPNAAKSLPWMNRLSHRGSGTDEEEFHRELAQREKAALAAEKEKIWPWYALRPPALRSSPRPSCSGRSKN